MRALIQRVEHAHLTCLDYEAKINHGMIVFLGIKDTDTDSDYDFLLRKIKNIRIFTDEDGKINKSLTDVKGEILLVSQFSLYGSVKNNNRPSFTHSAKRGLALHYYERMCQDLAKHAPLQTGVFGGHMHITYLNDGPLSILIDSEE